jgi:hypothetical protein
MGNALSNVHQAPFSVLASVLNAHLDAKPAVTAVTSAQVAKTLAR